MAMSSLLIEYATIISPVASRHIADGYWNLAAQHAERSECLGRAIEIPTHTSTRASLNGAYPGRQPEGPCWWPGQVQLSSEGGPPTPPGVGGSCAVRTTQCLEKFSPSRAMLMTSGSR